MINYDVLVKPDETRQDIIAEICNDHNIGPDEPFAFGAIMRPSRTDDDFYNLRINALDDKDNNPYTVRVLIRDLLSKPEPPNKIRYVQPPIEDWFREFQPLLSYMVSRAFPHYERLLRDKEELLSILYLGVMKLYNKGYYLHNQLIWRTFVNDLNLECRKIKGVQIESLNASIGQDDDGKDITLLDQLVDESSTEWAKRSTQYTEEDYWDDQYNKLKARMLEDMPEFMFRRILVQLATQTVDRNTSYQLDKYRQIFNPNYIPRPNAKGKNKGGKK